MKKQLIAIGILCVTAVMLLAAAVKPTAGDFAIRDQNFQLITVLGQRGSSTVYVIDNRSGKAAIFAPSMRDPQRYESVAVINMADLFATGR
jgi:hypothetical protein